MAEEIKRSPRRVLALTNHLPSGSALARSYSGGTEWGWQEELLAASVELQHATIRVLVQAYGAKKTKVPKPLVIPRPYKNDRITVAKQKKQEATPKRRATMKEAITTVSAMLSGRNTDG